MNSLASNDAEQAQGAFAVALRIACEGGLVALALTALVGIATLEANTGACEESLEIAHRVLEHPVSTQEAKTLATAIQTRLESLMTQEQILAAQHRARTMTLDELARRALASRQ